MMRAGFWRRTVHARSARCVTLARRYGIGESTRALATLPDGVTELQMPALSPTMSVGTISSWLKKEGEAVAPGDVLCQIETDKAVVDYEMQDDAVLAKIVLATGTADVPVGATLAYTVEDTESFEALSASGALSSLGADSELSGSSEESIPSTASARAESAQRQPLIKFLGKRSLLPEKKTAQETDASTTAALPSASASPSSPSPTTSASASASATSGSTEAPSSPDAFEDIALSNMRKIIAKRLTASKATVPHHYASIDCEIDNIMKLRQQMKSQHGVKVSLNDFLLKAVALALRDVPEANCFYDVASSTVQPNEAVDISVAVATAAGLITPIVPKVDATGLSGINSKFMELVGRARENKLKPEEFQGGSFTVSNLGGFGIDQFTAVINPPQACIMAVGRGRKELVAPTEVTSTAEPRLATLLNVTLSSDRRVVDDVVAGQFLQVFKRYMESPELMIL